MAGEDPFLRVERGEPDEAELAALVAALSAVSAVSSVAVPEVSGWRQGTWSRAAWRVSSLPR